MIFVPSYMRVFLAPGGTDMRKAINSLSILVESTLRLDLFSGHLFVFCNRVVVTTEKSPTVIIEISPTPGLCNL